MSDKYRDLYDELLAEKAAIQADIEPFRKEIEDAQKEMDAARVKKQKAAAKIKKIQEDNHLSEINSKLASMAGALNGKKLSN